MIDPNLLTDLVCPFGKHELNAEGDFLICTYCGVKFPVVDNIPILIIDEAILPEGITSAVELKCMKK